MPSIFASAGGLGLSLQLADYLTFLGYFAILSLIGYLAGRRQEDDASGYFLASRSLPWYVVGASYVAANISIEHFIGMVGSAVIYGICVATPEWSSIIAFSFLIWVFIPFLLTSKVFTAPEFLEKRFCGTMRLFFAVVTVVANVVAFLAPVIYGGGLVLEDLVGLNHLVGGEPGSVAGLYLGIVIIGAVAGLWAIWGGLKSLAWMDLFAITVKVGGGLLVTYFGLKYLAGENGSVLDGFRELLARNRGDPGTVYAQAIEHFRPAIVKADTYNRLSVIQPLTHEVMPWTHWVLSFFYIGLWYTVINQFMIQRVLAAKNQYHAQLGITFAGYLKLLIPFVVVVPGLIFFAKHPDWLLQAQSIDDFRPTADKAYVSLIRELVPVGVRGILLAALFGAIQSTVSAVLASTSTILTLDFYRRYFHPAASEHQTVRVGRWITFAVLVLAVLLGFWIATLKTSLFVYIQQLYTFFAPPFSAVFLLGTLWRRVSGRAASHTVIAGFALGLLVKVAVNQGLAPDWLAPYANQGVLNWAFCMLTCAVLSLLYAPPAPEQVTDDLTFNWRRMYFASGATPLPWYARVGFWWAWSVILMFALIIFFGFVL